jgi:CheY-like chemotaxis protein
MESRALRPLAVVEDSDEDYEALVRVLRDTTSHEGAVRYRTGEEALAGLPTARPALVLLDLNLPGIDGREVLAEIKADERLRRIPVCVLTTSRAEDDVVRAYERHTNCYVVKPLDLHEFRATIADIGKFWFGTVVLPATAET